MGWPTWTAAGAGVAALAAVSGFGLIRQTPLDLPQPVSIPFESVNNLVVLHGRIGVSEQLSFVLDTGASPGIIDFD